MAKNVMVYSTPTCPHCINTKRFLTEHGIEFTDIDVSSNQEKAQEMITKSGQMGVPVLDIEGEIIVGFDRPRIESVLGVS